MGLWTRVKSWLTNRSQQIERSTSPYNPFAVPFQFLLPQGSGIPEQDKLFDGTYYNAVHAVFKKNPIIFSISEFRRRVFTQAGFIFKEDTLPERGGTAIRRQSQFFYSSELDILRKPWPGGTSRDLLSRMVQDADIAGNAFAARFNNRLKILQPDWVTIIWASENESVGKWAVDAQIVGYIYTPQGMVGGEGETFLFPDEVAHFAPVPDPEFEGLGMPWWVSALREIMADNEAQEYIHGFFRNGAQPGTVITLDPAVEEEDARRYTQMFHEQYGGVGNAYKTVILGGGASMVHRLGTEIGQLGTVELNAAQETRIAMCGGVHPVLLGNEVSLRHGSYNMAEIARKNFIGVTMRSLWAQAAESLEVLVSAPEGSKLWYDDHDIPFLADDRLTTAEVQQNQAMAINTYISSGWEPETARDAVITENPSVLKHTGLVSVQLLPPGDTGEGSAPASSGNNPGENDE